MATPHPVHETTDRAPRRGLSRGTRRLWRRLIVPLLIVASMYGGFQAGERLGLLTGLYQLMETHTPGLITIGDSLKRFPALTERIAAALGQARCPPPRRIQAVMRVNQDGRGVAKPKADAVLPEVISPYPPSWGMPPPDHR